MRIYVTLIALVATLIFSVSSAFAHQVSTAYLQLERTGSEVKVTWDVSVKDLNVMYGLDANKNGEVTWGEVEAVEPELKSQLSSLFEISQPEGKCPVVAINDIMTRTRSFGRYLVFSWTLKFTSDTPTIWVNYKFLRDIDPNHAVFVKLVNGSSIASELISPANTKLSFPEISSAPATGLLGYIEHGVHHILIGYDHVAFLLTLLIPAVLQRGGSAKRPSLWQSAKEVAVVVTAFTLAHSITLALAVLKVVTLPSQPVEAAIALSIIISALVNIFGKVGRIQAGIAFCFGLLHGFGFASILLEEELPATAVAKALFGFNVGVELGQLSIVAVMLPLLFGLSRTAFYRPVILRGASGVLALVGAFWLVERL